MAGCRQPFPRTLRELQGVLVQRSQFGPESEGLGEMVAEDLLDLGDAGARRCLDPPGEPLVEVRAHMLGMDS